MKISGWGRCPQIKAEAVQCFGKRDVAESLDRKGRWIAYGLGRSYGDSALAEQVLLTRFMGRCLWFDPEAGIIRCEAGVSLDKIIETVLSRGWFLPVTPGTKQVTVGGAIAADVHGKNHHVDGCFSEWMDGFDLMLPTGEIRRCSRSENRDLFLATCGGMGLTGVVLNAEVRLRRVTSAFISGRTVPARNLDEILDYFEEHAAWRYLVAWVDCLSGGRSTGRSVLVTGDHAPEGSLHYKRRKTITIPELFPASVLNRFTARLFNAFYYGGNNLKKNRFNCSLERFFYPLDGLTAWNHLYGKQGLLQYQLVLPKEAGREGLIRILALIRKSGQAPFLGVLKLLGKENANLLTFPMEGYTLALDFKAKPAVRKLLEELDRVVADHQGRIYLAKDACMAPGMMAGYPRLKAFQALRRKYDLDVALASLQSKRLGL